MAGETLIDTLLMHAEANIYVQNLHGTIATLIASLPQEVRDQAERWSKPGERWNALKEHYRSRHTPEDAPEWLTTLDLLSIYVPFRVKLLSVLMETVPAKEE